MSETKQNELDLDGYEEDGYEEMALEEIKDLISLVDTVAENCNRQMLAISDTSDLINRTNSALRELKELLTVEQKRMN